MDTKIGLGIAVAGVVIAVAMLAPLATNAEAKKAPICDSGPTAGEGPCPGNSESSPNRCEQIKAGEGGGSGSFKTDCPDD